MNEDLLKQIEEGLPKFSRKQKLIADFILGHYEKAAYMTALKLGNAVGVSESTVVRFAIELGFEGYPQLQRSLQEHIKNRLTTLQRMDVTRSRIGDENPVTGVLSQDIDKIRRTLENIDKESFDNAVATICASKRIYIQGALSSGLLASFMHYYLRLIFDNVTLVGAVSTAELYQQMLHIGEDDLLIAMSFPRYASGTVEACRFARELGAHIISITDSESSPLVQYSHISLFAYSDMVSFVDSLVAPMSLINALIAAVSAANRCRVEQNFGKLEQLWDGSDVYKKDV
ncbi:MAG: MurR/RpiR family transcriptional regulator [Lachnospiraceae bacterium]|nr:MurR/RpiR family transcriptional regulator [Ruminococcus sp.]MCM1276084.1 MurR/RpiR family transcriptional regulator [Lachnospiraceae bacterium]